MPTGLNKSRDELPWLYYPRSNSVRVINSHLDGGGGLPAEDGIKRSNVFTSSTEGSQTVSADSEVGGTNPAWKAVAGNRTPGNGSNAWVSANTSLPHWWQIDFGSAQVIYSVLVVGPSYATTDQFQDFEIQSSDDNTNWTTRHAVTGATWTGPDYENTYSLNTPASARYWRIYITASSGSNRVGIPECEWYS